MNPLDEATLDVLRTDLDDREEQIRRVVYDVLAELPPPDVAEHVVASYFVVARTMGPAQVGREIAYHMTSGVRSAPPGSLLAACSGEVVNAVTLDPADRIGVVRVAFPLAMLLDEEGNVYSTDLLHITAGAGVFALTEHADVKLVDLAMSDDLLRRFPGPAYGAAGVRKLTGFPPGELAFGTILKPCTGITPEEEAEIVSEAASNPMFLFVVDAQFRRGFYCHTPSKIVVRLPAPAKTLSALVGVDSNPQTRPGRGSVVFSVKIGDQEAFRSDVLHEGAAAVPVAVDLEGATEFVLEVGDAGDGISCDQADWADAQVVLADGETLWLDELPMVGLELGPYTTDTPLLKDVQALDVRLKRGPGAAILTYRRTE